MELLGRIIRERRHELGMSADELSEKIGVARSTIYRWEKGDTDKIPANIMPNLQNVLKIDIEGLFHAPTDVLLSSYDEDAQILSDIALEPELLDYIEKLYHMNDSQRGRVYGYIDMLLEQSITR